MPRWSAASCASPPPANPSPPRCWPQ
jgi:hypothetical protein